jgi:MFS family permease
VNEPGGLKRALVSLQYRDYRLLFAAQVVAGIGGQLLNVSNLWQIYALTGSAVHLGLTGLARAIPVVLFSLLGGVVADRFDRRKIIVITQSANGLVALCLASLTISGLIQVWHIYAAVFINSTVMASSGSARRAVIATVVPREHLMNAMALNSLVHQADKIIAPAIAGILIAAVGTSLTYGLNGFTHMVTAVSLLFVSANLAPVSRPPANPIQDIGEGLGFVRRRSIILVMLLMDSAAVLFGNYIVLLPIIADRYGVGPAGYGLLASAPAVGSLVAASVVLSLGDFRYKGYLMVGALLFYAVCLAVLGIAPWFPLALGAAAGLGLADSLQGITRTTSIQMLTPDELRGRVSSFQTLLISGVPSLGQLVVGSLASLGGVPFALLLGAIVCATANTGIFVSRKDLRAPNLGVEPVPGHTLTRAH